MDAGLATGTMRRLRQHAPLLPAILFLILFFVVPCGLVIAKSFAVRADDPFAIYRELVADGLYLSIMLRTVELAAVTTLLCLVIGYPIAVLCARLSGFVLSLALLMILVPYTLSSLIRAYGWIIILNDRGIVNTLLIQAGILDQPVKLVFNGFGVYLGMLHVMLPVMILPIFAAVRAIDTNLLKASQTLGSGPLRTFLYVFLPLTMPGVKCGVFLVFIISLGFYVTPALLGGPRYTMLVNLIDQEARMLGNWETASAGATLLLGIILVLFWLMNRYVGLLSFFGGAAAADPRRTRASRFRSALAISLMSHIGRLTQSSARLTGAGARVRLQRSFEAAGKVAAVVFVGAVLLFLCFPIVILLIMSLNAGNYMRFPPEALSLRWFAAFLGSANWTGSLIISLKLAAMTTVAGLCLGALAAYVFARSSGRLLTLAMFLIIAPLVMPPIILAIGLYVLYVPTGLRATQTGLVIAHMIGALPLITTIMAAGFARFDDNLRRASLVLGAGPLRTFRKIVLPLMLPSFVSAGAFCFIHSFDELVISQIVAGVRMQTLPMRIFNNLQNEIDPTVAAVAVVVIGITALAIALVEVARLASRGVAGRQGEAR